jgi:predicted nucleic acid-binding protein
VILVDTSVWVDHLRRRDAALVELLEQGLVLTHPFVIGELALGNLSQREVILGDLASLPHADVANDSEVLHYIGQRQLRGRGIGYLDAHLLVSAQLTPNAALWTRDKRLLAVATTLSLAAPGVK